MPSGTQIKDDKAKLDAALAIAALSNELWDSDKCQSPKTGGKSENRDDYNELESAESYKNPNSVISLMHSVPDILTTSMGGIILQSEKMMENDLNGKFLRPESVGSANRTITESPIILNPAALGSYASIVSNNISMANVNQANRFFVPNLSSFMLVPLTSVSPSGTFYSQSSENSEPIIDPQLLQVLQYSGLNARVVNGCHSQIIEPTTSTKLEEEMPQEDSVKVTPGTCFRQMPGSLTTLRDYYSQQSETNADALSTTSSAVELSTIVGERRNGDFCLNERMSFAVDLQTTDVQSTVSEGIALQKTVIEPLGNKIKDDSSASVASESSCVNTLGSLSSLRSYYSSFDHPNTNPLPNPSLRSCKSDSCVSPGAQLAVNGSVAKLTMQQDDAVGNSRVSYISSNVVLDVKKSNFQHDGQILTIPLLRHQSLQQVNSTLISVSNSVLASEVDSSSPALSSPIRILPEISGRARLKDTTPMSSQQLSSGQKRLHSAANSVSGNALPPKKRKVLDSNSNLSQLELDTCNVLLGPEVIPFKQFVSRLNINDPTYQSIVDQVKSAIISQEQFPVAATAAACSSPEIVSSLQYVNNISQPGYIRLDDLRHLPQKCMDTGSPVICQDAAKFLEQQSVQTWTIPAEVYLMDPGTLDRQIDVLIPPTNGVGESNEAKLNITQNRPVTVPSSSLSSKQLPHPVLQPDEDGDLPLHVAVAQKDVDVVKQLTCVMTGLGASVDCYNHLRQTPLHIGVVMGDCDVVRLLLDAGASPNLADRKGQNCFHLAVQYKKTECLDCLFSCCSESRPDMMNYEGMTPLHLAVKLNQTDALTVLLRNGAQPDLVDGKSGHTALYMAADGNRLRAAEILLSHRANAQIASYSSCSPVQAASAKSFHDMVKLLMKHGATDQPQPDKLSDSKDSTEFVKNMKRGKC